jgi:hypothetical protein
MIYPAILQLYLLSQLDNHQPDVLFQLDGTPPHWAYVVGELLDMGAGLGLTDQFRGLHTLPIIRCLISSCGDALRTLLQDPVTFLDELKVRIVAATETVTNVGEHLEGN